MPSLTMFGQKLATVTEPSFNYVSKMSECGPVHFFQGNSVLTAVSLKRGVIIQDRWGCSKWNSRG